MAKKRLLREVRFCEFTGDDHDVWDGEKKHRCSNIGFRVQDDRYMCLLHNEPLGGRDGWQGCCESCTTPVQIKFL